MLVDPQFMCCVNSRGYTVRAAVQQELQYSKSCIALIVNSSMHTLGSVRVLTPLGSFC